MFFKIVFSIKLILLKNYYVVGFFLNIINYWFNTSFNISFNTSLRQVLTQVLTRV